MVTKNIFKGMSKKLLLVVILCVSIVSVSLVSAAYFIYSNLVPITVSQYSLTLNATPTSVNQYDNVIFTATLDKDGAPSGSGNLIHFYQGAVEIGTNTTDVSGIASFTWNMTNAGTLDFKAGFEVP